MLLMSLLLQGLQWLLLLTPLLLLLPHTPSGGLSQLLPPSVTTNSTAGALLLLPFRLMVVLSHFPGAEVTCQSIIHI
jgi:hypothetical protein